MKDQEAFYRATIIHDTLTTGKDLTIKFNSKNVEWIIKAAEALEKQIPMPKHKYNGYRCVCGKQVAKNQDYCEYCGQRLKEAEE